VLQFLTSTVSLLLLKDQRKAVGGGWARTGHSTTVARPIPTPCTTGLSPLRLCSPQSGLSAKKEGALLRFFGN